MPVILWIRRIKSEMSAKVVADCLVDDFSREVLSGTSSEECVQGGLQKDVHRTQELAKLSQTCTLRAHSPFILCIYLELYMGFFYM